MEKRSSDEQREALNPLEDDEPPPPASSMVAMMVSVMGCFSAIFNYTNIGYAIDEMKKVQDVPDWASSTCESAALWGSVVGMFTLGYVGDRIGRTKAMRLTLSLVVGGAICSGALSLGGSIMTCYLLVGWRFLLGIGMGGLFPLSAVCAGESTGEEATGRSRRVAWGMMGLYVGEILCPLVMFAIEGIINNMLGLTNSTTWRVMLACGAIPPACVLLGSGSLQDGEEFKQAQLVVAEGGKAVNPAIRALKSRQNLLNLVGAAGGWFALDFGWYGVSVAMPQITRDIFDVSSDTTVALVNTALLCLSIPGGLLSIWLVDPSLLGIYRMQLLSFFAQALCFGGLAAVYLLDGSMLLRGLLYGLCLFLLNSGAGITTYILPQAVFPSEDRSFLNGASAGLAKVGGALGIMIHDQLDNVSHAAAMFGCMGAAVLGLVITVFFVPSRAGEDVEGEFGSTKGTPRNPMSFTESFTSQMSYASGR